MPGLTDYLSFMTSSVDCHLQLVHRVKVVPVSAAGCICLGVTCSGSSAKVLPDMVSSACLQAINHVGSDKGCNEGDWNAAIMLDARQNKGTSMSKTCKTLNVPD